MLIAASDSAASSLDYVLFRAVNGLAGRNHVVDGIMIGFARYSPVLLAIVLIGLWLTWDYRNQRGALVAGVSSLIALGLGQLVGFAFPRDRPYLSHRAVLLIAHAPDTSFPSDHTTLAFAVAVVAWKFNHRLGAALLFLGIVTAFARVFVGAHYLSDVAGGAVLGGLTGLFIWKASRHPSIERFIEKMFRLLATWHLAARRAPPA